VFKLGTGLFTQKTMLMECSIVAQQWLLYQPVELTTAPGRALVAVELVTAVSGRARLRSLGERHFREAASQFSHGLFLQPVTMGSNSEFNKEFM
jgi:hypothetical protein